MSQRPRPDRLRAVDTVIVNFRCPLWLRDEITLLALDPRTGKMPYGAWSRIIEAGLRLWLEDKKITQPMLRPLELRPR